MLALLINLISTDLAKSIIALAVNKLLAHSSDGITKDIATTMIDGIAKSKANPTTADVFADAVKVLKA